MVGLTVLTASQDTIPFAEAVAAAADKEKDALGFLPESKYADGCASGRLFVAIDKGASNGPRYAGHLLFGGTASEIHIHQLLVHKRYRRRGVASALIDALIEWAEGRNYLGLAARVASDLIEANNAWERLGFRFIRAVKGGTSRKRVINLRHRELRTKSLLGLIRTVGRNNIQFGVPPNIGRGVPTYGFIPSCLLAE